MPKLAGSDRLLAFVITAFQFYILQAHIPSASNFQKVRDEAFSKFWAKLNGKMHTLLRRING